MTLIEPPGSPAGEGAAETVTVKVTVCPNTLEPVDAISAVAVGCWTAREDCADAGCDRNGHAEQMMKAATRPAGDTPNARTLCSHRPAVASCFATGCVPIPVRIEPFSLRGRPVQ
jgi:hypothetical protein